MLCASYSGNTEETLACYESAGALGARRMVVTTGGRLAEMAREDGVPVIPLPGGFQPRAAVAYMTVAALEVAALKQGRIHLLIVEVMTDKAAVEVPAPVSGRVVSVTGAPGDKVAVGSPLIVFELSDGAKPTEAVAAPAAPPAPAAAPAVKAVAPAPTTAPVARQGRVMTIFIGAQPILAG